MFEELGKAREAARREGQVARMMANDGVIPEKGGVYTISPDFVCGDRSYTRSILEVVSINECHAAVKVVAGDAFYGKNHRLLAITERAWFPANEMLNAMTLEAAIKATQ